MNRKFYPIIYFSQNVRPLNLETSLDLKNQYKQVYYSINIQVLHILPICSFFFVEFEAISTHSYTL